MTQRRPLMIVGAGGFGQEVVWAARNFNAIHPIWDIVGYCDDDPAKKGQVIYGVEVLGPPEEVNTMWATPPYFVCAIGDNLIRSQVVTRLLSLGWKPATIIDPSVIVAEHVTVGEGTYIGAGTILSPYARIGNHVIINHNCSIGHDSVLEDFVQVSPGGRVSGSCVIKEGALLGSNAIVSPGKEVGRYATVGGGSFAMTNIPDGATAIGVPARIAMYSSKHNAKK